jgi:hypothetical protein
MILMTKERAYKFLYELYGGIERNPIPERHWQSLYVVHCSDKTPIETGQGTHCYNEVYTIDSLNYDFTFSNEGTLIAVDELRPMVPPEQWEDPTNQ